MKKDYHKMSTSESRAFNWSLAGVIAILTIYGFAMFLLYLTLMYKI